MSLVNFLNPSKLTATNWIGQIGLYEFTHMCAARNEHVVRNERISEMTACISKQKALNGE